MLKSVENWNNLTFFVGNLLFCNFLPRLILPHFDLDVVHETQMWSLTPFTHRFFHQLNICNDKCQNSKVMRLTQKVEHKKNQSQRRKVDWFLQRCSILQIMMDRGLSSNSEFPQSHATIWGTEPEKQCNINEFFEHTSVRSQICCPF